MLVYSTDANHCWLALRLPAHVCDRSLLPAYTGDLPPAGFPYAIPSFSFHFEAEYWLVNWEFSKPSVEIDRFIDQSDGPGWLARLLPLRDEILQGDLRALYLGWLARASNSELPLDSIEPPLPAGLLELTPAQQALVEFLMLDVDWLASAAQSSEALADDSDQRGGDFDAWMSDLEPAETRRILRLLVDKEGRRAEHEVTRSLAQWKVARSPSQDAALPTRRTVRAISANVEPQQRLRLEREEEARLQRAEQHRAAQSAQQKQLLTIADDEWRRIDTLLQLGSGAAYGKAFIATAALAEAYTQNDRRLEFQRGLARLLSKHGRRAAWVTRLQKAGFMWKGPNEF